MRLRLARPGAVPDLRRVLQEVIRLAEETSQPDQPLTIERANQYSCPAAANVALALTLHSIRHAKGIIALDKKDLCDTAPPHNRVIFENAVNVLFMMTNPETMADRLWRWAHVSEYKILRVAREKQNRKKNSGHNMWATVLSNTARVAEVERNYQDYLNQYGVPEMKLDKTTCTKVPTGKKLVRSWSGLSVAEMVKRLDIEYWAYSVMSMEVHGDMSIISWHFTPFHDGKIFPRPDTNEAQVLSACAIYLSWGCEGLLRALDKDPKPAKALLQKILDLCSPNMF